MGSSAWIEFHMVQQNTGSAVLCFSVNTRSPLFGTKCTTASPFYPNIVLSHVNPELYFVLDRWLQKNKPQYRSYSQCYTDLQNEISALTDLFEILLYFFFPF